MTTQRYAAFAWPLGEPEHCARRRSRDLICSVTRHTEVFLSEVDVVLLCVAVAIVVSARTTAPIYTHPPLADPLPRRKMLSASSDQDNLSVVLGEIGRLRVLLRRWIGLPGG